jgi:outer membrane protein OmpA-like peptidoglycan-associated protein/tetratricopeptide (TPR) repeat protein
MKILLRKTLILSFLAFHNIFLFSQDLSRKEFIKIIQNADAFFYYDEDFEKAAQLYESLLKIYPDNANLSAKLGICYINIDGKGADALRLLEKASSDVVASDKDYVEYGEQAPLDTYLYRAIAYHRSDSLNKAISLYFDAKKKLSKTEAFRDDYIETQIKACRYAIEMHKEPVPFTRTLFIPWLEEFPEASNPVISENDSVFVFTQKQNGKTRVLCSYKSTEWNKPVDITKQLGSDNQMYSNSITCDGKLLIIYMDDNGNGNLYFSQRKGSTWTKIKSLGKNINSIYWEAYGFITPDGKTLYLASNRPGGMGELDIWISEPDENGAWNRPVNCGKTINTPYNENTPFFDPSSNTMLFSSAGHTNMGGYDQFRSVYKNGSWSQPLGLPYSLNNTTDDINFLYDDDTKYFTTSLYNEEKGSRNIYILKPEDKSEKSIVAHGTISLQDGMPVNPGQTKISLSDQRTGELIRNISLVDTSTFKFEVKPGDFKILISHIGYKTDTINIKVKEEKPPEKKYLKDTATFNFDIKPGEYQLAISHSGYRSDTLNLDIPIHSSGTYIAVKTSLVPEKVTKGGFLEIKNILFDYNSYALTDKATATLEILKSTLISYPDLRIEVAGYTDSIGSVAFNTTLADRRAQAVIDYLSGRLIPTSRFIKKACGKSNFVALNTNTDGSDNPEGRKYNRRVSFGILDPGTGVVLKQETYTPQHLRQNSLLRYGVVLVKSNKELSPDYFKILEISEIDLIKLVRTDSSYLYYTGTFYNKMDADKYLGYAVEKGFYNAFTATQNEIINEPESLLNKVVDRSEIPLKKSYTIQLSASKQPLNMIRFKSLDGVVEVSSDDGYYRYIFGEYNTFAEAEEALKQVHKSEFKDAYIRYSISSH